MYVADAESPEVDRFTVQLKKDENGLGITIAGNIFCLLYNSNYTELFLF